MFQSTYHWKLNEKKASMDEQLVKKYKLSSMNQMILENRGFVEEEDLELLLNPTTHDPFDVYNMDIAVNLIEKHLENKSHILIYGDYDADGITSTTILYRALKKRNENVSYFIPNRVEHGYGLNYELLQSEVVDQFDLVITVDNGVTAVEEVKLLKENNIDVLIIDHHTFSEEIPDAVIIHPDHPDGNYSCKTLAGVGITYKVIEALNFQEKDFLELVAIGTVADMVPMFGENKYFTIEGLKLLNDNPLTGIESLLNVSKHKGVIDEETIGFKIAPRLNATGRIDEASLSVNLLLTTNLSEATMLAEEIEMLNDTRKEMVEETFIEAKQFVNETDKIHVIYGEDWHPGILGIVASRIVEAYGVPAILLTRDEDLYTGSARSINTVELLKILNEIQAPHIANGHNQAFGVKVDADEKESFKVELTNYMNTHFLSLKPEKNIDLNVEGYNVTLKDLESFNQLRPFGHGFLAPTVLANRGEIQSIRKLGVDEKHLKLEFKNYNFEVIGFNFGHIFNETTVGESIYAIGRLGINEFNGVKKIQMILEDIEIKDMQIFDMRSKANQNFDLIDKNKDIFFIAEDKEKISSNYYHYGEVVDENVTQVVLRDLPILLENFEQTIRGLSTSKLISIFDDKDDLFFSGIPTVQMVESVYETVQNAEHGQIDLKRYAPALAKRHKISMDMLVKITNILTDLNRIAIKDGVLFYNHTLKEPLVVIESKYYKQLQEKLNAETVLKMSSRPELKTYIEKLMNE